jgi:hypothetical protein
MPLSREQIVVQIDDVIRTMPPRQTLRHETDENLAWLGRVSAAITAWSQARSLVLPQYISQFSSMNAHESGIAFRGIMILLHEARHQLMMETQGPTNIAVAGGRFFDYFDEIRKIIELAKEDLLFVDPYLDSEFVSRYLPHVGGSVRVRLLAREKLAKLIPAAEAFAKQTGMRLEVRSAPGFHDRYIFVDGASCYQSGASFKDGAKSSPTTLTQITDAFNAVRDTYEAIWNAAKVER